MPMSRRQQNFLDTEIERIAHDAVVVLSKRQLRYFYDAERMGRNSWRDIAERLPATISADIVKIIEHDNEIFLIRSDWCQELSAKI